MVNMNTGLLSSESNSGLYPGHVHMGPEFNKPRDHLMDFQADNGGFFRFNPDDLQVKLKINLDILSHLTGSRLLKNV